MATESTDVTCVNHPRVATRVRCSACDDPICVDCMQQSAVGMKCPSCAKVQYRRPGGKRRWMAGATGLALAAAAGFFTGGRLGFLGAIVVGVLIGATVRTVGRKLPGIGGAAAAATICGLAMGLLALGAPIGYLLSPAFLFPGGMAALAAAFTAGR